MKLGLFGLDVAGPGGPDLITRIAAAADEAGIESLWTGEHIVVPDPMAPPSHVPPTTPLLHPSVMLAYLAAATTTVKLGTGVTLLPMRNPLVVAKEYASLDHVSGGRAILGVGVGYVEAEFEALGLEYHDRGRRTDDYVDAIRAMWTMEQPKHSGPFVQFDGINAYPRPVQSSLPILIGGSSPATARRVVERGDGWFGSGDLTTVRAFAALLDDARGRYDRDPRLGAIELTVNPGRRFDHDLLAELADLGVTRIVTGFRVHELEPTLDGYLEWVDRIAAFG